MRLSGSAVSKIVIMNWSCALYKTSELLILFYFNLPDLLMINAATEVHIVDNELNVIQSISFVILSEPHCRSRKQAHTLGQES